MPSMCCLTRRAGFQRNVICNGVYCFYNRSHVFMHFFVRVLKDTNIKIYPMIFCLKLVYNRSSLVQINLWDSKYNTSLSTFSPPVQFSFTFRRNSRKPSTVRCGTPLFVSHQSDSMLLTFTLFPVL